MVKQLNRISIALVVVGCFLSFSASAQARGQCGPAVSSWKGYYQNLQSMGVVNQAAKINRSAGYSSTDGSFKQWLKERVISARLHRSATIDNYGCNPGTIFGAGKKHLSKGWPVLVALPNKYAKKDVRSSPRKGYKAIVLKVKLVGQRSCTNPGKATVYVKVYVKKTVKAKKKAKKKPKPAATPKQSCESMGLVTTGVSGMCTVQTQTGKNDANVENDCKGPNSNSQQCNTTINQVINQVQITAACVQFIYGDGSIIYIEDGSQVSICSSTTETCKDNSCNQPAPTPTPTASARCTSLVAIPTANVREVSAMAMYTADNAKLTKATFHWDDGKPPTVLTTNLDGPVTAKHTYEVAKQYGVYAVLEFTKNSGGTFTDTCATDFVTPKVGELGPGTGTPGTPGGSGSGGDAGGTSGARCYNDTTKSWQDGVPDQEGYCSKV